MTAEQLHLQLELDPDSNPIAGQLTPEQGDTIAFVGWLELMSALQKALNDRTGQTKDTPA
jgi:hypothetical protein